VAAGRGGEVKGLRWGDSSLGRDSRSSGGRALFRFCSKLEGLDGPRWFLGGGLLGLRGTSWLDARGTFGYRNFEIGDSATGERCGFSFALALSSEEESCLSSSSSSGVGSLGDTVSKEVWLDPESRMFVDVRDVVRERLLLRDFLVLNCTVLGVSFGRVMCAGLAFGV
jgi:hypothetical protein